MKFTLATIIATTAAIRIASEKKAEVCVSEALAKDGFEALDTDDSKFLSYDEIKVGVEELAKSLDHVVTADEWAWIEKTGEAIDSKTPGKVDQKEFYTFANALFKHFELCDIAREMAKEAEPPKVCVSKA
jgi:hypothetical protein